MRSWMLRSCHSTVTCFQPTCTGVFLCPCCPPEASFNLKLNFNPAALLKHAELGAALLS